MQKKNVTSLIGEDYLKWQKGEHIILDCGTGTGKTYFVIRTLGLYCVFEGKKILYLCNRARLRDKVLREVNSMRLEEVIDVMTYQLLQENNYDEEELIDLVRGYDFIVLDEFHYIESDAWNGKTDIIENLIRYNLDNTSFIFASATALNMFSDLKRKKIVKQSRYYRLSRDYGYVNKIMLFNGQGSDYVQELLCSIPDYEKVVYICSNKEKGYQLKQSLGDRASFICTAKDYRNEKEAIKIIGTEIVDGAERELVSFDSQVLIATSVLDVGVDLIDRRIKHIVTDFVFIDLIEQSLGRKRELDSNDTCTFHIRNFDNKSIAGIINGKKARIVNATNIDKGEFDELELNNRIVVGLEDSKMIYDNVDYDWVEKKYILKKEVNKTMLKAERNMVDELEVIKELGFQNCIGMRFRGLEVEVVEEVKERTRLDELELYLKNIVGISLTKDKQEELVKMVGLKDSRNRLQKSISVLNPYLEENFGYKIENKRVRIEGKQITVWILVDILEVLEVI